MLLDQGVQQVFAAGREVASLDQKFAQRLGLGEHPCLHGADEAVPGDEVHLKGEDAEEKVSVGSVR
jgi:hypothetical protein